MNTETTVTALAVGVVAVTLALSGPAVSAVSFGPSPGGELDDGNATVASASLDGTAALTDGRFGTGVAYLRVPDATVRLSAVTGNPRLVYRVSVPGLGVDAAATTGLGPASRRARVRVPDRAFEPATVDRDRYRGTLSVHVQSFAVYRTVLRRNVTVEVATDG